MFRIARTFVVISSIIVAIVLIVNMPGCRKDVGTGRQFRFAQLPITYSSVTYLAEALGFCKREGLSYFALSVPAGPDVVAILRNSGPSGAQAGGIAVTPVATMIAAGDEPVILATTVFSDQQVRLLTFNSTGITEDPASLKNKRIGVVRNTVGDIYLSRYLAQGGLSERNVVTVNGRPADLSNLLLEGNLDAAVFWDPFITQTIRKYRSHIARDPSKNRGEPAVYVKRGLYTLAFNIVTTRQHLDSRRLQLLQLLRASIAAGAFIGHDRAQAQSMLEKWLGLELGDLDYFMETTRFNTHLQVQQMQQWLRTELEWLKERQIDVRIPADLSRYVDASLLRSINPTLVSE